MASPSNHYHLHQYPPYQQSYKDSALPSPSYLNQAYRGHNNYSDSFIAMQQEYHKSSCTPPPSLTRTNQSSPTGSISTSIATIGQGERNHGSNQYSSHSAVAFTISQEGEFTVCILMYPTELQNSLWNLLDDDSVLNNYQGHLTQHVTTAPESTSGRRDSTASHGGQASGSNHSVQPVRERKRVIR